MSLWIQPSSFGNYFKLIYLYLDHGTFFPHFYIIPECINWTTDNDYLFTFSKLCLCTCCFVLRPLDGSMRFIYVSFMRRIDCLTSFVRCQNRLTTRYVFKRYSAERLCNSTKCKSLVVIPLLCYFNEFNLEFYTNIACKKRKGFLIEESCFEIDFFASKKWFFTMCVGGMIQLFMIYSFSLFLSILFSESHHCINQ